MVWDGSRSGLVGKGLNGALGSTLVRINFPRIENNYAFYFLQSKYLEINTRTKGTGTPHVDPDLLWNYKFPVAPLKEQQRIVSKLEELFSELDKGIESFKTAREQLTVYRQAVLKHAFEGKLTEEWRKKHADELEPTETLLEKIKAEREQRYRQQLDNWKRAVKAWEASGKEGKNPTKPGKPKELPPLTEKELSELPELPESWIWIKYGEFIDESQNGLSKRKGDKGLDYKVLRLADLKDGLISDQSPRKIIMTDDEIHKYQLKKNDLVCIRVNGSTDLVGRLILVKRDDGWAFCDHFIRFRQFQRLLKATFSRQYFDTQQVRRFIKLNMVSSAGQNTVSQVTIMGLAIPHCPFEEQVKISEEIESRFSVVHQLEQDIDDGLRQAEALRQSLLKKAFEGRLVPQDPNDEPASVLLERIKTEKAKLKQKARKEKKVAV